MAIRASELPNAAASVKALLMRRPVKVAANAVIGAISLAVLAGFMWMVFSS